MKFANPNNKILRWFYIVVLVLIIALPLSYIFSKYVVEHIYESTAILIFHNPLVGDEGIDLPRILGTYRAIATGSGMMSEVIKDLNLDCTPEGLKSMITVSYEENTGLIFLKVRDRDGERAKIIADFLIEKAGSKIEELLGEDPLRPVDGPYIPTKALWPNTGLNMLISFFIGISLSALIIVWGERRG